MNLKDFRKEKNLTQSEVAAILGIGQSGYCQIEKGIRILTIKNAKLLAEHFNVDWKIFYED